MRQLEESLRRLKTDYLDLWQMHECAYDNDPERHFANGGVIEALDRAKREGKVRFVGFTGHKDPAIHLRMLVARLSVRRVPAAAQRVRRARSAASSSRCCRSSQRQGIAPIGMKSLCGERRGREEARGHGRGRAALRDEPAGGHDRQRHRLDARAEAEPPRSRATSSRSPRRPDGAPAPPDGGSRGRWPIRRYKTTAEHDGDEGREQHGFPLTGWNSAGLVAELLMAGGLLPSVHGRRPRRLSPEERKSLTHGDFWIPDDERDVYRRALQALNAAAIPYVVAGAYAIYEHTGIYRQTKDLDLFVEPPAVVTAARVLTTPGS